MAFATPEDVATRLGRELTAIEGGTVALLLDMASGIIADAAGQTEAWVETVDPVPQVLRAVCIEVTSRAMGNPEGLANRSESLGAYSSSVRFRDDGGGLFLSKREELLVSRTVNGSNSGSARLDSNLTDIFDMTYGS